MNRLRLFLTTFLLLQFFQAYPIEKTFPVSEPLSREFYKIYLHSLYFIDHDLPLRYGITEEELDFLLDDVKTEREIVKNIELHWNRFDVKYDQERIERFLIAEIYRFLLKKNLVISTDDLKNRFNERPDIYPPQEHLIASQIFVALDEKKDEKEIKGIVENIRQRLESEPFSIVARDYYKTVGLDFDGRLGRVFRGKIADENFDLFLNADPALPFFGPVKQKRGYLFGKTERKLHKNADPVQYYRQSLELDCRDELARKSLDEFYDKVSQNLKPQTFDFDPKKKEPLNEPAYRLPQQTVSYLEIKKRFPHVTGDALSLEFHHALRQKSLENDLVFFSDEADKIKNSPEYRFLSAAHKNAWIVFQYVKNETEASDRSPEALKKFHEQFKNELYQQSDLVRLAVITLFRNIAPDDPPYQQHLKQKADFETIHRIRDAYLKNPDEENLKKQRSSITGMVYEIYEDLRPSERAGGLIESQAQDHQTGYISPVLIGGNTRYLFFHIIERKKRAPLSFEEVQDRLAFDFSLHKKREILKRLYQSDRVFLYY